MKGVQITQGINLKKQIGTSRRILMLVSSRKKIIGVQLYRCRDVAHFLLEQFDS